MNGAEDKPATTCTRCEAFCWDHVPRDGEGTRVCIGCVVIEVAARRGVEAIAAELHANDSAARELAALRARLEAAASYGDEIAKKYYGCTDMRTSDGRIRAGAVMKAKALRALLRGDP